MDIARFDVDIAHFETTTTYTAIFIGFFQILYQFFYTPSPEGKLGFIFWCMPFL
jgi:hypothetical protein